MRSLRKIADRHGLSLIEDAAHCIEGLRDAVRPGELSDAAYFSFYATKNLTCGEGGLSTSRRGTGCLPRAAGVSSRERRALLLARRSVSIMLRRYVRAG
jgi:hypothetical protein